jgi:hypothetical protein
MPPGRISRASTAFNAICSLRPQRRNLVESGGISVLDPRCQNLDPLCRQQPSHKFDDNLTHSLDFCSAFGVSAPHPDCSASLLNSYRKILDPDTHQQDIPTSQSTSTLYVNVRRALTTPAFSRPLPQRNFRPAPMPPASSRNPQSNAQLPCSTAQHVEHEGVILIPEASTAARRCWPKMLAEDAG